MSFSRLIKCEGEFLDKNNGTVTGIATALLTVVTIGWMFLAVEQNRTTRAQLRAYVFITAGGIQAADKDGVPYDPPCSVCNGAKPVARIKIENSGQTPAYDVQIFGRMDVVAWPIEAEKLSALPYDEKISRSSLGPHASTFKYETLVSDRLLQAPEENDLKLGKQAIVIHGEIRYRDVFGMEQRTKYRWFIGGAVGIRGVGLAVHEDGNDAT